MSHHFKWIIISQIVFLPKKMTLKYCACTFFGIMLLALAMPPSVAAQGQVLQWDTVDAPGTIGNIVVHPSEVSDFAGGRGDILYAADSANGKVYRSDNAGLTWTDLTSSLINAGADLTVPPASPPVSNIIACAPDQPGNVAIVTDGGTRVYASTDFGADWKDTRLPALALNERIQCIAISKTYPIGSDNLRDVAIGTAIWGNGITDGQLWVLTIGGTASTWHNTNITVDPDPAHPHAEVSAIAFSPDYADDGTILAVASTNIDVGAAYISQTWLCAGQGYPSTQTTAWNSLIGYPVEIAPAGDADGVTPVTAIISSLALPSDYRGNTDQTSRKVLVSYDRQPDSGNDVYRIDDTTVIPLNIRSVSVDIRNIAYYGTLSSGKLMAGDVNHEPASLYATQVWRLSGPFDTPTPTVWTPANQPPTCPGNAKVAWSYDGGTAFCGTSQAAPGANYDESAFSRSADNGNNWEQTSLINTLVNICDIAPAPDSKSLFLASYSTGLGPESVWRAAGEPLGLFWGRILTLDTTSDRLILRLSPDYADDYTIYVTEVHSRNNNNTTPQGDISSLMAVSHTRGNYWQKPSVPPHISDMLVTGRDTFYVILDKDDSSGQPGGFIRKATHNGNLWLNPPVSCFPDTSSDINMLALAPNGNILAGSWDNRVSYSTDNGTSFTQIREPMSYHTGDVQVVADANYGENNLIYASDNVSDDGIWRWTIGASGEWEQIDREITDLGTGQRICGLGMGTEGTLYALRSDSVTCPDDVIRSTDNLSTRGGGMDRSLNPTMPFFTDVEFDVVNSTLPYLPNVPGPKPTTFDPTIDPPGVYPNTVPSLKLVGDVNHNVAWTVDYPNELIYIFDDNICKVGPVTNGPGTVGCDAVSGRNQEMNLAWEQLSLSDRYEIEIAKDNRFSTDVIEKEPVVPEKVTSPAVFIPAGGAVTEPASQIADWGNFECGHTYYWRTRTRHAATTETIRSPWSQVSSFTIKAGLPVSTAYYGPELLSPDNGCLGCPVGATSFSWAPYKETSKYRFVMARDAAMTQVVIDDQADTSAYEYTGRLRPGTAYYWRVMALEPSPSDWSATFTFHTAAAQPSSPPTKVPGTPAWVWVLDRGRWRAGAGHRLPDLQAPLKLTYYCPNISLGSGAAHLVSRFPFLYSEAQADLKVCL